MNIKILTIAAFVCNAFSMRLHETETITTLLKEGKFTSHQFDRLLVKKDGLNHLLLSDVNNLLS
jgi:hypothetical protein